MSQSPGEDSAAGGVIRAFGQWTLTGRGTENTGTLVYKVEHRHRLGTDVPPQDLGFENGCESLLTHKHPLLIIPDRAVLELVAAIGLFNGSSWAVAVVIVAAVCGVLVEIQDIAEDGFGVGKLIFLAINTIALFAAQSAKTPKKVISAAISSLL